ncbi:MAG: hypothetical protein QM785_03540 [Pyrinomonadaceae bacterium]
MGAWGTGISSNDTYADVFGVFFDLYNDGVGVAEASAKLIKQNQETIDDPDDANNFWFALARFQWDCGQLDPILLRRVTSTIESGSDIDVWRRLDASENDLRKRAKVLAAFLEKLRAENAKPRARKRKSIKLPPFEKGTCLAYKLSNGNYGGAVIIEAIAMEGFGMNLVASTRLNQPTLPTVDDFLSAEVLLLNFVTCKDEPQIVWKYSIRFRKDKDLFINVGKIEVSTTYDPHNSSRFSFGGFWSSIVEVASLQFESERTKNRPRAVLKLAKLTRPSRWKFW